MVTLFSALSGHLSFNGAPLAGAEVVQTAYNRRKKYTQRTITNEHGYFFFDKLTRRRTFIDYLPAEPLVSQEITLHVHGSKFLLWSFLRSEEHTSELQSRPHLVCRLLLEKK